MLIRLGLLRKAILGIPPEAATNEFTPSADEATDAARQLERVATTFLFAYNATLEKPELSYARFVRDSIDREYRGFAVEGIGMALAVAKLTNPFARVNRGIEFGDELGGRRRILAYVGVGWAYAMLRRSFTNDLSLLHPSSREWVFDGHAFFGTLLRRKKVVTRQWLPRRITQEQQRLFDQGLGRALWFLSRANVADAVESVREFTSERQRNIWGGVGIASCYAGTCDEEGYAELRRLSADYFPELARGCAAACFVSVGDGFVRPHTEIAARVLWDSTVADVAARYEGYLQKSCDEGDQIARTGYVYDHLEQEIRHVAMQPTG